MISFFPSSIILHKGFFYWLCFTEKLYDLHKISQSKGNTFKIQTFKPHLFSLNNPEIYQIIFKKIKLDYAFSF